jgi:hypothetical protein
MREEGDFLLRLFVNVYSDSDPRRAAELEECLRRNRQNPRLGEVVVLAGRPTFREFFAAANRVARTDDISVIANSDIFFDDTLKHAATLPRSECFALSRWDVTENGDTELYDRSDSQDAWIFRGSISDLAANFTMGVPGCDNRLARLLADAGYCVTNPSRTIRANHLHLSRVYRYDHGPKSSVPGPYLCIPPTALDTGGEKLLHFALLAPGSPQRGLRDALRSICSDYHELDWHPYYCDGRIGEMRAEFSRLLRQFAPTLVFAQIQTAGVLSPGDLKAANCPIVSWCGDVRDELPAWSIELAPHVISCFTNLRDVEALRVRGHRAEYLQIGISPGIFKPKGALRPGTPEIVFMGNNSFCAFPLSGQRREMVAMLSRRYGERFSPFGNHWGLDVPWLSEPDEAAAYRSCKVAINQNHYGDIARFTSDRLLRAMGSGAFVISNHYPGIELEFTPGKHLVTWRDFPELVQRIDCYLEHDDERRAIASEGCAHVHAYHTWVARMNDLQDIVSYSSGAWWRDLDRHASKIHSQTGEDGVIRRIFKCIGITNRFLIDIGAGDGVTNSNTCALRDEGWSGLLLDAMDGGHEGIVIARVTAQNVNMILDAHDVPAEFDLLSIDIDGIDYWVWHAFRRRPRVVVMEFNGTFAENERRTVPYDPDFRHDGSDYYGTSLAALEGLSRAKGYTLVHQLHALNAFFVRTDLLPLKAPPVVRYTRDQYHPHDPHDRPWQTIVDNTGAFNGDQCAAKEIADLCRQYSIATIIEGGTYHGESTPFLSALADRVYTIEIDDEIWPRSQHLDGIWNITRIKGSSPIELRKLLPAVVKPVLYYADSHWGVPSPLPDELLAFAEHDVRPVLVVHDFRNPDHPDLGFDTYGGQPYEWEWIEPYIEAIYGGRYRHYFNEVAGGARRGILYVVPKG